MEELWNYSLCDELRIGVDNYSFIFLDPIINPKINREKIAKTFFEKYEVPFLYFFNSSIASMYSFGKSTGMMVDLGEGLSHFVPIYDGYFIPKFIQKDITGKDLTEFMAKMLFQKGKTFSANDQIRFVEDIKKKACYTALDFEKNL